VADAAYRAATHALVELGIRPGDRVASFAWNDHRHLELYYAVPGIGAVLHTTNIRLFPEQVCWVLEHAGDKFAFVDGTLAPLMARAAAAKPGFNLPLVAMGDTPEPIPGAPACVINGPFYPNSHTRVADVTDGLSNTVFIGERSSFLSNTAALLLNAVNWPQRRQSSGRSPPCTRSVGT